MVYELIIEIILTLFLIALSFYHWLHWKLSFAAIDEKTQDFVLFNGTWLGWV